MVTRISGRISGRSFETLDEARCKASSSYGQQRSGQLPAHDTPVEFESAPSSLSNGSTTSLLNGHVPDRVRQGRCMLDLHSLHRMSSVAPRAYLCEMWDWQVLDHLQYTTHPVCTFLAWSMAATDRGSRDLSVMVLACIAGILIQFAFDVLTLFVRKYVLGVKGQTSHRLNFWKPMDLNRTIWGFWMAASMVLANRACSTTKCYLSFGK